jgi:predicted nuclease of predicted toxin-antitoxin system
VPKFLIDECLSLDLVEIARNRGFVESSHVVWMGKAGWKDWELKSFILEGDWTLVTRNSVDFRGRADNPGTRGQFADVPLHTGLICINGPDGMIAEVQCELFEAILDEIGNAEQLVNEVVEVDLESLDGEFTIHRYQMPEEID